MSATFRDLAPGAAAQLGKLAHLPLIQQINETAWIFAIIETAHLLSLAILGGAVLVLNLQVLGAAPIDLPAARVERATRPWLIAGIAGALVTGVAMSLTTVNTLLGSAAFLVKMIALVAAILFSLAVSRAVRRDDAGVPRYEAKARLLAILATLWWFAALALFVAGEGLASGAFLVALAGFVLFAVLLTKGRRTYLRGLAIILGGGILIVEWASGDGVHGPAWLPLLPLAGALLLAIGVAALERRVPERIALSSTRLAAFASTLAWITVAAAGRWIGFS